MRPYAVLLGLLLIVATTGTAIADDHQICAKHEDENVGGPYGDCVDKPDIPDLPSIGGGGGGGDDFNDHDCGLLHLRCTYLM